MNSEKCGADQVQTPMLRKPTLGVISALAVAFALCISMHRATGFDPDEGSFGHSAITHTVLTSGYNLWGRDERPFVAELLAGADGGAGEEVSFTDEAVANVVLGARSMDFLPFPLPGAGLNGTYLSDVIPGGLHIIGRDKVASAHCDDEQIAECSREAYAHTVGPKTGAVAQADRYSNDSAVSLLEYAADLWLKDDATAEEQQQALAYAAAARVRAGRALHILQDFYAHSNWSDTHREGESLVQFGRGGAGSEDDNLIVGRQVTGQQTCAANRVPDATIQQIKDYEIAQCIALASVGGVPPPASTIESCQRSTPYANYAADPGNRPSGLVEGLLLSLSFIKSTILDWWNSGGNGELVADGASSVKLTSGYFLDSQHALLGVGSAADVPVAKCDHGFNKGVPASRLAGINKDAPWTPLRKGNSTTDLGGPPLGTSKGDTLNASLLHELASHQAALGTKALFQNIIKVIGERAGSDIERRDTMVQLFLGHKPAVAIVVDTTGSMQDIKDGLKADVHQIFTREAGIGPTERKFALTTYGESNAGIATIVRHKLSSANGSSRRGTAVELLDKLLALPQAFGGGDCPEPTLQALLETIRALPPRSKLYAYTDASTKNRDITVGGRATSESAEIIRLVKRKKLEVTFSLSGSCSPISQAFHDIADASGGQVMLVDHASSETSVSTAGVPVGKERMEPVAIQAGALAAGESAFLVIPVEAGAVRMLLPVSMSGASVSLRNPTGQEQMGRQFLGGIQFEVAQPVPGNWSLVIKGGSVPTAYVVRALVSGQFALGDLEFTSFEPLGSTNHPTYTAYGERPPATTVRVLAQMKSASKTSPASHTWQAVGPDGKVLGTMAISRLTADTYVGTADMEAISAQGKRSWRLRVSGVDDAGQPFQRMSRVSYDAAAQVLSLTRWPQYWVAGAEHIVRVRLDNFGPRATFSAGNVIATGPASVSMVTKPTAVESGDYAEFELKLALPATAPAGSTGQVKIDFTAGLVSQTIALDYFTQLDTDGDGVPDFLERGSSGLEQAFDGNGDGVSDWQQSSVASFPGDGRRAYFTITTTAGSFKLTRPEPAEGLRQIRSSLGLIDFRIVGLSAGQAARVDVKLPKYMTAAGYEKFGPVPGGTGPVWYDFSFDEGAQLGAKVNGNVVSLHLRDGAKGDDDLLANGEIIDLGGPVGIALAPASTQQGTPGNGNSSGSVSAGGGGGCTLGRPGHQDHSTLLLLALASLALVWRAWASVRHTRQVKQGRYAGHPR